MSGIDAYLLELSTSLGGRLPCAVREARLREARAHLLASAAEVGEAEAVGRFGRAHRGYGERSAWALAFPLYVPLLASGSLVSILVVLGVAGTWTPLVIDLGRSVLLLVAVGFLARAVQTRRWLAGPMVALHVLGEIFLALLSLLHRGLGSWSALLAQFLVLVLVLVLDVVVMSTSWLLLNALALGLGRGLELRRVRRTR